MADSDSPRRIGRPPIDPDDASVSVSVRLPSKQFDELYERAQRERVTVRDVMRAAIKHALDND